MLQNLEDTWLRALSITRRPKICFWRYIHLDDIILRLPLVSHGQGQGLVLNGKNWAAGSFDLPRVDGDFKNAVSGADDVHVLVETLPGGGWNQSLWRSCQQLEKSFWVLRKQVLQNSAKITQKGIQFLQKIVNICSCGRLRPLEVPRSKLFAHAWLVANTKKAFEESL